MKKIFLCSLVLSLLNTSRNINTAEASAQNASACSLEKIEIVFASGKSIFKPDTSWVSEKHLGNLTLGIPVMPLFENADVLSYHARQFAGPELAAACKKLVIDNGEKAYPVGTVKITPAFNLQKNGFNHIAHAVVPYASDLLQPSAYIAGEKEQNAALQSCYSGIFQAAHEKGSSAVVTIPLGTGLVMGDIPLTGYSMERSMKLLKAAVFSLPKNKIERIYLVLLNNSDLLAATAAIKELQFLEVKVSVPSK